MDAKSAVSSKAWVFIFNVLCDSAIDVSRVILTSLAGGCYSCMSNCLLMSLYIYNSRFLAVAPNDISLQLLFR